MDTTGQPSSLLNWALSSRSPRFSTKSIMFIATTIGTPNSKSWVVRYRFRSKLAPSTMFKMALGGSFTR